jgi:hypothetical protein
MRFPLISNTQAPAVLRSLFARRPEIPVCILIFALVAPAHFFAQPFEALIIIIVVITTTTTAATATSA